MSTPNIAWVAGKLLDLHNEATKGERVVLLPSLISAQDWLISDALVAAGFPLRSEYDRGRKHIFRAKLLFCTGTEPDTHAYCQAQTLVGSGCRNRPAMGILHCSRHASEQELDTSARKLDRWTTRYTEALHAAGVKHLVDDVEAVLSLHRSNPAI